MIAICPVGPPQLMNPSLIQKRAASANETPWVGAASDLAAGVGAGSPGMSVVLAGGRRLFRSRERSEACGASFVGREVGIVAFKQRDRRLRLLRRLGVAADR